MHGTALIDRAQLPGGFISHPAPDTVTEKSEWHSHQRLECISQLRHQRAHRGQWRLRESRGTSRQLDGTEIDPGRHEAPRRPIERRTARGMGKAKHAAANRRAFISKRYPLVQGHCGCCSATGLNSTGKETYPRV